MKLLINKPLYERSLERQVYKALRRQSRQTNPHSEGYSPAMAELSRRIELDALRWGITFHPQAGDDKANLLISRDGLVDFSNMHLPLSRRKSRPQLRVL
jgi:hypothetical protein